MDRDQIQQEEQPSDEQKIQKANSLFFPEVKEDDIMVLGGLNLIYKSGQWVLNTDIKDKN